MLPLKPFAQSDWWAFAGAECALDGRDPQTCEVARVQDWPIDMKEIKEVQPWHEMVVVVVDAKGIELLTYSDDGEDYLVVSRKAKDYDQAMRIASMINVPVSFQQLDDLGFKEMERCPEKMPARRCLTILRAPPMSLRLST